MVLVDDDDEEHHGSACHAEGRSTTVRTFHNIGSKSIKSVRVIGKEELTLAERARDDFVLSLLQGVSDPHESEFIDMVWFPKQYMLPSKRDKIVDAPRIGTMNDSQSNVVHAMTNAESYPIVIVHG